MIGIEPFVFPGLRSRVIFGHGTVAQTGAEIERLGSKRALEEVNGKAATAEFASDAAEIERAAKYGTEASDLLVALHEVIGHGSGKLSDRVSGGAQPFLKEYFSTLEEGRADPQASKYRAVRANVAQRPGLWPTHIDQIVDSFQSSLIFAG